MFTTGHAKNTARNATGGASSAALLAARLTSWSTEHHVGPLVDPALAVGVDLVGRELVDLIGRHGVLPELRRELDAAAHRVHEIGRAACRERVCRYVYVWVVAGSLKKKNTTRN